MDFNINKPSHLVAFLLIIISFFAIIILPIFSYFGFFTATESTEFQELPGDLKLIFEIILLVTQFALVIVLLVIFPIIWYLVVNNMNFKQVLSSLKLDFKGISFEKLCVEINIKLIDLQSIIMKLEMKNLIQKLPGEKIGIRY